MPSPAPQPRLLDAFQAAPLRATRLFLGLFLLLWLALLSTDWIGRFALFHWHRIVLSPAPAAASNTTNTPPAYHSVENKTAYSVCIEKRCADVSLSERSIYI